jgi:hypothetical protein
MDRRRRLQRRLHHGQHRNARCGVALKAQAHRRQVDPARREFAVRLWRHGSEVETRDSHLRLSASGQIDRIISASSGVATPASPANATSSPASKTATSSASAPPSRPSTRPATKWTLEGGPGYKIDELRATTTRRFDQEESFGGRVSLALQPRLQRAREIHGHDRGGCLRHIDAGFEQRRADRQHHGQSQRPRVARRAPRHDPPPGFEPTDTATKFSLVYKIE